MKERGKNVLFLIFFLFAMMLLVFARSEELNKSNEQVYEKLEEQGQVNVVVKIEEKQGWFKDKEEKLISKSVTAEEMEELVKDRNVKTIEFSPQFKAFLQDSVIIVNATNAWATQVGGINITGIDTAVCVIDTGVNFSHPSLIGKNMTACLIDCYNKDCIENCSIIDDNGHGTHVAGIIAASSGINGVAINVSIIGLKLLDENGWAHGASGSINLIDSMNWCIENKNEYNISVMSLSLGTEDLYADYCDDLFPSIAEVINNATLHNISVIYSTGNDGDTDSIAAPACIENATAVGSIRKDDITFDYNRNIRTDFVAPGYLINSTRGYFGNCLSGCSCSGNYMRCSGTSMATPHVSGGFALLHQYLKIQEGHEPKPYEIENFLKNSSKVINDSNGNGLNFYRLDVYSALISSDSISPLASLVYPANNIENLSRNQTFRCNATDSLGLRNITLQIWNSSSIYYQNSTNASGKFSSLEWNVTLDYMKYHWNCKADDLNGNSGYADSNFTLNITDTRGKKIIVIGVDGFQYSHYVALLKAGVLGNFTRLMANGGFNTTINITGHSQTATAPGNSELHSGLNETLTNITNNGCNKGLATGNSTFERIKAFNSSIVTGLIYGKTTCYVPNGVLGNSLDSIDWFYNRTTYNSTNWTDGTTCDDSRNVSRKAAEFIGNYSNSSFYLFVYYGAPDCSGHTAGDNSLNYNNSFINVDDGLGILLDSIQDNEIGTTVQIIVTSDHGWNENSNGHSTFDENTTIIPLITNNLTLIQYSTSDGAREQCEIAPTTLDYFGVNESDYMEITDNGCDSMIDHDIYPPQLTIISPSETTYTSSLILFNFTLDEEGYCEYSLNNGTTNNTMDSSDNLNWHFFSTLSNGAYIARFYCNDTLNNKNYSEEVDFLVAVTSSSLPSGGGGGGGSAAVAIYRPTTEQMKQGYTKEIKKGDKMQFTFYGQEEQYTMVADYIGEDWVILSILDKEIKITLNSGEDTKLDLTFNKYYLNVKLNSIQDDKANITIIEIYETTKKPESIGEAINTEEKKEGIILENEKNSFKEKNMAVIISICTVLTVAMLIILALIIISIKKPIVKNEKSKVKPQREKTLPPNKGRRNM